MCSSHGDDKGSNGEEGGAEWVAGEGWWRGGGGLDAVENDSVYALS